MVPQHSQKKQKREDSSTSTGDEITDRDIFIEMSNKMTIVIEKLEDLTNAFNQKMDGLTNLLNAQKDDSINQVEKITQEFTNARKEIVKELKGITLTKQMQVDTTKVNMDLK